jgi:hypothetical protein
VSIDRGRVDRELRPESSTDGRFVALDEFAIRKGRPHKRPARQPTRSPVRRRRAPPPAAKNCNRLPSGEHVQTSQLVAINNGPFVVWLL